MHTLNPVSFSPPPPSSHCPLPFLTQDILLPIRCTIVNRRAPHTFLFGPRFIKPSCSLRRVPSLFTTPPPHFFNFFFPLLLAFIERSCVVFFWNSRTYTVLICMCVSVFVCVCGSPIVWRWPWRRQQSVAQWASTAKLITFLQATNNCYCTLPSATAHIHTHTHTTTHTHIIFMFL